LNLLILTGRCMPARRQPRPSPPAKYRASKAKAAAHQMRKRAEAEGRKQAKAAGLREYQMHRKAEARGRSEYQAARRSGNAVTTAPHRAPQPAVFTDGVGTH